MRHILLLSFAMVLLFTPAGFAQDEAPDFEALIRTHLTEAKHMDFSSVRLEITDLETDSTSAALTANFFVMNQEEPMMRYRYKFEKPGGEWILAASTALPAEESAFSHPPLEEAPMALPTSHPDMGGQLLDLGPVKDKGLVGMLVMLNNFLHDLAVAMYFIAWMALVVIAREKESSPLKTRLEKLFFKTGAWSFVFILALGGVRAATYAEYEWYEMVRHGQVAALVVKHIAFVIIIVGGWVYLYKTKKKNQL